MSFKQFLAENSNTLTATKEFESILKLDPNFAKKLQVAWDGDERDYAKDKQIDSLFLKLIQPDAIKKMSKLRLDDLTHEITKKLETLHRKTMPHDSYKPKFVDKSIWSHERMAREHTELRAEVEKLLSE
jgi:hypothetical protein